MQLLTLQDLVRLLDGYLAPLQQETFLSSEEVMPTTPPTQLSPQ